MTRVKVLSNRCTFGRRGQTVTLDIDDRNLTALVRAGHVQVVKEKKPDGVVRPH